MLNHTDASPAQYAWLARQSTWPCAAWGHRHVRTQSKVRGTVCMCAASPERSAHGRPVMVYATTERGHEYRRSESMYAQERAGTSALNWA
eukprot:6903008-Alexandrium_andersonii.AAC.1